MKEKIPEYLESTYRLLTCAYPDGIDNDTYKALLFLLYDHASDRHLAEVFAYVTDKEYYEIYNDALCISESRPVIKNLETIKQKLLQCGFDVWAKED